jgi:glycosyltransferase involved in cell wall biosynthesis
MTENVKLTVGIPTFNRAKLLTGAMESALTQSYTSFRLIVSDNASEDDTAAVVRSFSDERISYVRSERNIGSTGNLNRLIGLAETEFLLLLPDDDVLYPGHLQAVVDVLERFENIGLAHSAFDLIDADSRIVRRVQPVESRSQVKIERRDHALERLMVSPWGLGYPSIAYRTEAIRGAGALREEEGQFGDLNMWMRIALDWDFGYIANPGAGFRIHSERVTDELMAQHGVSDARERSLLFSQIIFEKRVEFLDYAPLGSRRERWLRALALLQLLIENAGEGLPWKETAERLGKVVRTDPRILRRPALWRLVAAQLGGRRARSALRRLRRAAPASCTDAEALGG